MDKVLLVVWIVYVVGLTQMTARAQDCQCTVADHKYSSCNCLATWSEAEAFCRSRDSQLATVRSEEEGRELSRVLNDAGVVEAWIGAKIHTGDWRWTTSERPLQSQGCYQFTGDLTQFEYHTTGHDITPSTCMFQTCEPKGFTYAAVTRGDTCLCMGARPTNNLGTGCDLSCSGNANERCGGGGAFYLYHTDGTYSKPWGRGLPDASSQQPLGACLVLQCRYSPFETWEWTAGQCLLSEPRRALCETDKTVYCEGTAYNGKCYTEPQTPFFSWYDANYHCHTEGGHLAEITSEDIYYKITQDVVKCFRSQYWIGGSRGTVKWMTGTLDEPAYYTDWNGEFPTFSRQDSCVFVSNYAFNSDSTLHKWGDQNCNYNSAFVCQSVETTTTDSAVATWMPQATGTDTKNNFEYTVKTSSTIKDTTTMDLMTLTRKEATTSTMLSSRTSTVSFEKGNSDDSTSTSQVSFKMGGTFSSTSAKWSTAETNTTVSATASGSVLTGTTSKLREDIVAGSSTTHEENITATLAAVKKEGISGAEVGGGILIAISILIVLILCALAIYYCAKVCRKYMAKKSTKPSRDSPPGPFVRDIDFSYMDVSRTSSTESKSKRLAYDKEKSLQRYNSLDINKELKKVDSTATRNENMNFLNNQTQTGSSLNKEDDTKPLTIDNKELFGYIDNVGSTPKESNLQLEKETLKDMPCAEVTDTVAAVPPTQPKQKTVIQITTDEDIIQDAEHCDHIDPISDTIAQPNDLDIPKTELPVLGTKETSSDPSVDSYEVNMEDDRQQSSNNDGYIGEDFEDASYAHPREYELSYA